MLMRIDFLEAALIADVPNPEWFIIAGADDVLSTWVENNTSYPIIVTR